jgi:hypothetical protein
MPDSQMIIEIDAALHAFWDQWKVPWPETMVVVDTATWRAMNRLRPFRLRQRRHFPALSAQLGNQMARRRRRDQRHPRVPFQRGREFSLPCQQ